MANVNALIAAGPHTQGIDVRGNAATISQISGQDRRNQLMDIGIANAPERQQRATTQYNQEQQAYERTQTIQMASDFLAVYETAEAQSPGSGMQAASQVINALPDTGKFVEMKQNFSAAMASPETTDDQEMMTRVRGIAAMAGQEGSEGYTLAQGAQRYENGQLVAENPKALPKAAETFTLMSPDDIAATPGLDPSKAYQRGDISGKISSVGGGGQTINLGGSADELRQKYTIEGNQEHVNTGRDAQKSLPNYERGLELIKTVETGAFEKTKNEFKKYALSAGFDVDVDKIASFEELAPIFGKFLFEGIQQTKGSVSDKEMQVFERINANYGFTTEGNRRLLEFGKQKAEREIEIAKIVKRMRINGDHPYDVQTAVDDYIADNEIGTGLGDSNAQTDVATVTTQEQFDALPSGAFYVEDGQTYRKP